MRISFQVVTALLLAVSAVFAADEEIKSGPQPGTEEKPTGLPSSFQAWMLTGQHAGAFHAPVAGHALNPTLMLFVRSLDEDDKVIDLLKKVEELSAKHPDARLGCTVIVLDDGGFRQFIMEEKAEDATKSASERLVEASRVKDGAEKKFKAMNEKLGFKNVAIGLYSKVGPKGYEINPDAHTTALIFNKHVILNNHAAKEKLNEEQVAEIARELEALVRQVEYLSRPRRRR